MLRAALCCNSGWRARVPLRHKSSPKLLQPLRATGGLLVAGFGLHAGGELQQFAGDVVERVALVVQRALAGERVALVRQRPAQGASDVEHAGQADGAEGVQPVGVLHDLGFQRLWRNLGREAVCGNGVRDRMNFVFGKAFCTQQYGSALSRQARSLCALRVDLRQVDQIVQIAGR